MAAWNGSNGVSFVDKEGRCSTFITSSLCESAEQKAGRLRKHKGSWYHSLH